MVEVWKGWRCGGRPHHKRAISCDRVLSGRGEAPLARVEQPRAKRRVPGSRSREHGAPRRLYNRLARRTGRT